MVSSTLEKSSFVYKIYRIVRGVGVAAFFLQARRIVEREIERMPTIRMNGCLFMLAIWANKTQNEKQALPDELLKFIKIGRAIHIRGKLSSGLTGNDKYF